MLVTLAYMSKQIAFNVIFSHVLSRDFNWINTTGTTSAPGTAYHFGRHEFVRIFSGIRAARYLDLCAMYCRSLLVLLAIALAALLRHTASDYTFVIFQLF